MKIIRNRTARGKNCKETNNDKNSESCAKRNYQILKNTECTSKDTDPHYSRKDLRRVTRYSHFVF